jgi:hypothetical protein
LPFSPAAGLVPDPDFAANVVWFDALVTNVDRTPQNPNLLEWHRRIWLIDHGAALYWHHTALPADPGADRFAAVRDHVLLPYATSIPAADGRLAPKVSPAVLEAVAAEVPVEWVGGPDAAVYVEYLSARLASPRAFVEEAENARL